jgi:electron transport complex protein RnfD
VKPLLIENTPHIRDSMTTQRIMRLVMLALLPASVMSVVHFGWRAALLIVFCTVCSTACEGLCRNIMKREQTVRDGSAALTGLLLALNLPVTIPLWEAGLGCFAAIVLVKQLFGGLGQNFANPAITARIMLLLSVGGDMTHWIRPGEPYDAVSSATPLASGDATLTQLFWGTDIGGSLGETSAAMLLLGGVFLMVIGIISPVTPLSYLGTVAVCTMLYTGGDLHAVGYQLLAGGLMLGAFFMATDYVTTPVTASGKLIFGIGCGVLTFLIRYFGRLPEGVSYAILLMNILTPYIDRFTTSHPFGVQRKKEAAK